MAAVHQEFISFEIKQAQQEGRTPLAFKTGRAETMMIWIKVSRCTSAIREFVAPTYQPERHYMRGPGPACARRASIERPALI